MTRIDVQERPGTKYGALTAIGPYIDSGKLWVPGSAVIDPPLRPVLIRDEDSGELRQMWGGVGGYWYPSKGAIEVWFENELLYTL